MNKQIRIKTMLAKYSSIVWLIRFCVGKILLITTVPYNFIVWGIRMGFLQKGNSEDLIEKFNLLLLEK